MIGCLTLRCGEAGCSVRNVASEAPGRVDLTPHQKSPCGGTQANDATKQLPVFVGHGSADPLVPASLATRTIDGLKASGVVAEQMSPVVVHIYCR